VHRPLTSRTALVTGASRRGAIGAAVARRLAADGADLLLHSWSPHDEEQPWGPDTGGVDALLDELRSEGVRVEHVSADLADPATATRLVEAAGAVSGHLDVLVAVHARSSSQDLEHLTVEELDRSWAVNARATLLLVQAFAAAHDDARAGGRVLLCTSGQSSGAMPGELPYIASKAVLHQLTRSLAVHLAPRGITVNTIDPGPTDTGWADAATLESVAAVHPSGRWSTPADTARAVGWLASDEAEWITGQVLRSDGGWASR
jgi:3-oxoacyl-[acyl-carrier protein] reductase